MQKVAFITGCSTGIGRELAQQLNNKGWKVIATARRADSLESLDQAGCITMLLDVTDPDQIVDVVRKSVDKCGKIDILVNNAGYGLICPVMDIPLADLQEQFKTNMVGAIYLIQKVAPFMKNQGGGTIVNIGSISGIAPTPFSGAYCASKAAIHAWSDVLRMELKPFGIRVVNVQPGGIVTDFGKNCEKTVRATLKQGSWYAGLEKYIYSRAGTSQEKATPVALFVKKLIPEITKDNPPAIIRIGQRSRTLPMMKRWLPVGLLDKMMMKKYGLENQNLNV